VLAGGFQDVINATQGAPWLWWAAALLVLVVAFLLIMKAFGLLPD